ncbi:MAG: RNase H [Clostridium sp.]|nr:RNase H [Clostridium sp.]
MTKKSFYAVRRGKVRGIFDKWSECLDSVSGYPKAEYKGFVKRKEAEAYLKGFSIVVNTKEEIKKVIYEDEDNNNTYYVVRRGRKVGLYKTWEECKEQIIGFSKAEYKKVKGKIPALKYLNPKLVVKKNSGKSKAKEDKTLVKKKVSNVPDIRSTAKVSVSKTFIDPSSIKNRYEFIAFVDGSYNRATKTYGSGVVVLGEEDSYDVYSKSGYDEWGQWNIVSEIEATKLAINKAKEFKTKNVAIYHDLMNISLWASGEWKAKNRYTQEYVRFIEKESKEINIYFIKVKGHSDESFYNDLADEVARKAIAII